MEDLEIIRGLESCLREDISDYKCEQCPYLKETSCLIKIKRDALSMLKEQQSRINFLEHQREKGHWIFGETGGHSWMKCSQCCVSQDGQTLCFSFCPNCGAVMNEEAED